MLNKRLALQIAMTFCLAVGAFGQPNLVGRASKLQAPTTEWTVALSGEQVRESSPVLADINSSYDGKEIVVAGSDGRIYAYRGNGVKLWEFDTNSSIESSPAVGDIDNDGDMEIVVGLGSQYVTGEDGGVICLNHSGGQVWRFAGIEDRHGGTGDVPDGRPDGVYSTPALGDLDGDGDLEIVFGAWDHWLRALNDDGTLLWSVFMRDTIWSSPALGDINRDGFLEIAIGVDSHYEAAFGTVDGGAIHVFTHDGAELPGFPQYIDQALMSSPALGDINGDGWLEIVTGTGAYFPGLGRQVHAWDHNGDHVSGWPKTVDDYVFSSPALGDMDNDGLPDVVVGCNDGKIYAWKGNGSQIFALTASSWGVRTSPTLADYDGDGQVEVLYSYSSNVGVIDYTGGSWSVESTPFTGSGSLSSSPAIGDIDSDANVELVAAGGQLYAWQLDLDDDSLDSLPWPMFRRDAMRNGHLPAAPILSASPTLLTFMHQTGDSTQASRSFHLTTNGDCAVDWTASAPAALQVTPASGTITPTVTSYNVISVKVSNPASYAAGTHSLGSVTVAEDAGSPNQCGSVDALLIPVTLEAGDFSRIYLPGVMQQYGSVLFSDDFSDLTSGWPSGEDSEAGRGYFGLEYGVHINQVDLDVERTAARGPFSTAGDYAVQVDARGTTMAFARCGVVFNAAEDMSDYYYFVIDNRYPYYEWMGSGLWHYQGGSSLRLEYGAISGTTVGLYEPNTLRVEVVGSQIRAYVDDVEILSYNTTLDGGYIGLYTEHGYYGEPGSPEANWSLYHKANCHFDNFIVTSP